MKSYTRSFTIGLIAILSILLSAQGSLLVHEGFDYGGVDTAMGGLATNATGLTGNYTASNTPSDASANYRTAGGLSFGSSFFATTGGSVNQRMRSSGVSYVGATLSTSAVSGDLWGSYLFNFEEINSINTTGQVRLNTTATGVSGSSWFNVAPDLSNSGQHPQISYDGSNYSNQSGFEYVEGTTYLLVSKFTNVGASLSGGSPGVASLWIFAQDSYEDWVAGGGSEAQLATEADGVASISLTTGSYEFSDYLQYAGYSTASTTSSYFMDEIRYGTTLGDVVAIPEPTSFLLMFSGFSLLAWALRRRA